MSITKTKIKTSYVILSGNTPIDLSKKVTEYLSLSYELYGNPLSRTKERCNSTDSEYIQAVIKHERVEA